MNSRPASTRRGDRIPGYVLLEIIIALTVFAVVVTGLAGLLHSTLDSANLLRKQAAIRRGMEALLMEARDKTKREEMILTYRDEPLGIEFKSSLEEVKWLNRAGQPVRGLYLLSAVASDFRTEKPASDRAEVYVYRP